MSKQENSMRVFQHLPTALNCGVAALSLAASGWAMASGLDVATAPAAQANAKTQSQTSAKVVARMKANGSGVIVNAAVPTKVAVGQTVSVRLNFNGVGAEGATAEVREAGANGRVLLSAQLPGGKEYSADVPYQAQNDGMQYLDVTTTQNGRTSIQQVAVAVGSGQMKLKPSGTAVVTPTGERLVTVPSK
jgi:hypothetical protein